MPSEPDAPDAAYEKSETRDRVRAAIAALPLREQKVIGLYYYGEVTMKEIGAEIGVNESRVSQLHARAIRRLRDSLGEMGPQQVAEMRKAFIEFAAKKPVMAKATLPQAQEERKPQTPAIVLPYKPSAKRAVAGATPLRSTRRVAVAR